MPPKRRIGSAAWAMRPPSLRRNLRNEMINGNSYPSSAPGLDPSAVPLWLASLCGLNFLSRIHTRPQVSKPSSNFASRGSPRSPARSTPSVPQPGHSYGSGHATSEYRHVPRQNVVRLAMSSLMQERELLDAAANDPVGPNLIAADPLDRKSSVRTVVLFIERGDPRSAAKLVGRIGGPRTQGTYPGAASPERHFYAVTQQGYDLARRTRPVCSLVHLGDTCWRRSISIIPLKR